MVTQKLIIVFKNGIIQQLGGVMGPILSPFWCDARIIEQLINLPSSKVFEILGNNTMLLLTKDNFNTDNGGQTPPGGGGEIPSLPSENPNTMGNHLKEKLETTAGIHGSLRYNNNKFEKFNATTNEWTVAFAEDLLELDNTVSDITIGGIKKGDDLAGLTIDQVINKLIHPSNGPTIYFTALPTTRIHETGTSIEMIKLSAIVSVGDAAISSVKFKKGDVVISEPTVSGAPVQTYVYNITSLTDELVQVSVEVSDNNNNTSIESIEYKFVLPKFNGVIEPDTIINGDIISSMTKIIDESPSILSELVTENQKLVIAIPSSLTLNSIYDKNNFDVTNLFETTEVDYNLLDGSTEQYKIISSIEPMTISEPRFIFNNS